MMNPKNKPLISYLLFCYNQEKYISKAVESALAQNYSPLEIIISDDCSSDSTYSLIKNIITSYKGPHRIILNRNKTNLGLSGHVNKVMSMANGELFVIAAGDDISFPNRVERIVEIWLRNPELVALCSGYANIDENDNIIDTKYMLPSGLSSVDLYSEIKNSIWAGCSAVISSKLYKKFGNIKYKDSTEDRVLFRRALLLGKVYRIKEPLIYYRVGGLSGDINNICKKRRLLTLHFYGLKNFLHDIKKVTITPEIILCKNFVYCRCYKVLIHLMLLDVFVFINVNLYPVLNNILSSLRIIYRKYIRKIKRI